MQDNDALTGLISKLGLEQQLLKLLTETRRNQQTHGLLYLDLDQFSIINDSCGQVAGNELLRQLAILMGGQLRASDILARLGGDEFAVLLPHCDIQHAVNIAELLLQAVNDFCFTWQDRNFPISVSIGLVAMEGVTTEVAQLLEQADQACYMAKELGRNRLHVFNRQDQDRARHQEGMLWASRIRHALDEDRLVLYTQEIVPIAATGSTVHRHELFVRMVDTSGRIIPSEAFMQAAERYDLMPMIDRWVVKQALLGIAGSVTTQAGKAGHCFINLSTPVFSEPAFYTYLLQQLEETDVSAEQLCFEMSEQMAIANLQPAVSFVKSIRDLGCHFALNQYGSCLHSFSYLKTIPVDYLKIGCTLIRNVAENDLDRAIVAAINNVAHAAGASTIAECVDSEKIYQMLQKLELDFVQGTYLQQPTPWLG